MAHPPSVVNPRFWALNQFGSRPHLQNDQSSISANMFSTDNSLLDALLNLSDKSLTLSYSEVKLVQSQKSRTSLRGERPHCPPVQCILCRTEPKTSKPPVRTFRVLKRINDGNYKIQDLCTKKQVINLYDSIRFFNSAVSSPSILSTRQTAP